MRPAHGVPMATTPVEEGEDEPMAASTTTTARREEALLVLHGDGEHHRLLLAMPDHHIGMHAQTHHTHNILRATLAIPLKVMFEEIFFWFDRLRHI